MIITEQKVVNYMNKMYSNFYEATLLPPKGMTEKHWIKHSLSMNHYEHEVSYRTKKEIFGTIPKKDEMKLINALLNRIMTGCSDRELLRKVSEFTKAGIKDKDKRNENI